MELQKNYTTNVRPGRNHRMVWLRSLANTIRSFIYFKIRTPWVKTTGMVRIAWNVELWSPNKDISLGVKVQFGPRAIVHCDAIFGNNILVARNVAFIGRDDHTVNSIGKTIWDSPRGDSYKTIVEDDVWIGHGAIILSGVKIGRGSVIAAGSLVKNDVPRYSIVAGVPAKVVSMRFNSEEISEHEDLLKYNDKTLS